MIRIVNNNFQRYLLDFNTWIRKRRRFDIFFWLYLSIQVMLITLVSVLATFSPVSCHNLHLFLSNFGGIYYLRVVKYLFHFLCTLILVRRISFQKNGLNVYQIWRLFLLVLIESRFMILNDWASQDAFTLNSFLLMVIMIIFLPLTLFYWVELRYVNVI